MFKWTLTRVVRLSVYSLRREHEDIVGSHSGSYLQVTIRRRGRVVLSPPATGLGSPTSARPVLQLFDGCGGALNCIEVP